MVFDRGLKRVAAYLAAVMVMVPVMTGCGGKVESTEEAVKAETAVKAEKVEETVKAEVTAQEEKTEEAAKDVVAVQAEHTENKETAGDVSNVVIDYGTSEVYTKEDMDQAIEVIEKEFGSWEGCELKEISYTNDQKCSDNLSYINSLGMDMKYDECIVFTSMFHSPVEGGGAWEADTDYENWDWYLGRTDGGNWELLTWGY